MEMVVLRLRCQEAIEPSGLADQSRERMVEALAEVPRASARDAKVERLMGFGFIVQKL